MNDNPPIFEKTIYQRTLPENYQIETIILKVHATDQDENENARITYSIDDRSSTFIINQYTGEIYLKKSLDYERTRAYSLTIKGKSLRLTSSTLLILFINFLAQDNGVPQLTNYATLIIDVTDVNDHSPDVLLTEVNGTKMNNRLINLPECTLKGIEQSDKKVSLIDNQSF